MLVLILAVSIYCWSDRLEALEAFAFCRSCFEEGDTFFYKSKEVFRLFEGLGEFCWVKAWETWLRGETLIFALNLKACSGPLAAPVPPIITPFYSSTLSSISLYSSILSIEVSVPKFLLLAFAPPVFMLKLTLLLNLLALTRLSAPLLAPPTLFFFINLVVASEEFPSSPELSNWDLPYLWFCCWSFDVPMLVSLSLRGCYC